MVIMQPSVWISIWYICFVNIRSHAKKTTACFISNTQNCDLFDLTCENNTRIRITGTEYRYINKTDNNGNNDNTCCSLNANDCKENYTYGHAVVLYDKCSGKRNCLNNRAPQPIPSQCDPNYKGENLYIHVLYECIHDDSIFDMCNSTHAGQSEVNILFMKSPVTSSHSRTCMCYVTSNQTITYQLVDVRLFTNVTTNGDYVCLENTFSIGRIPIRCQPPNDRSFAYMNSPIFTGEIHTSGTTKVLELSYMEYKQPDMVWVNVKGQNNFAVYCTSELTTTTTGQMDTEGGAEDPERLIIILVVVGVVLVFSAILVIVFISHRRRCKKSSQEDAPKNQLPDELINHRNMNCDVSDHDCKAVEISNYDQINDEYIESYSRPVQIKIDGTTIDNHTKKTVGQCSTDEYDRLESEKKYAVKMANYDRVTAIEVNKLDDTYSHASSQSKHASLISSNDYSHCQFVQHEPRNNGNTNKTVGLNEPLVVDNYSHVDLSVEKTKRRPSISIEEDTYNHIDLDTTTNPPRNGHVVRVRNIAKSEESSQTFKDIQSFDVESELCPESNTNYGVSSEVHPLQDIKAVSLPDNYIEFKVGDIYDTPRRNVQHNNVVLKGNTEHLINNTETGSKQNSGTEENNDVSEH
ncbi:hypothetical protein ACJMK2_028846 [Sinanodonta woodiana]|uniref:SUEL-type lectin domain-containing protein n=1 Tax=Sinanodonta woodiana TaxID=1069815 RepID=A0ABD3X9V5_SINWO